MADYAGSLLVRAGLITEEGFLAAQHAMRTGGATLAEVLIVSGTLSEERLVAFFHERLLVPRVGMPELAKVTERALARIPVDMAVEFRAIPVELDREGNLIVAMADPSDTHAADEIGFFTGNYVVRAVAPASAIAWALHHYHRIVTPLLRAVQPAPPPADRPTPERPAAGLAPLPAQASGAAPARAPEPAPIPAPVALATAVANPSDRISLRRLPPAQVIEDVFGEETPLPKPIPFDVTGTFPVLTSEDVRAATPAAAGAPHASVPATAFPSPQPTGPPPPFVRPATPPDPIPVASDAGAPPSPQPAGPPPAIARPAPVLVPVPAPAPSPPPAAGPVAVPAPARPAPRAPREPVAAASATSGPVVVPPPDTPIRPVPIPVPRRRTPLSVPVVQAPTPEAAPAPAAAAPVAPAPLAAAPVAPVPLAAAPVAPAPLAPASSPSPAPTPAVVATAAPAADAGAAPVAAAAPGSEATLDAAAASAALQTALATLATAADREAVGRALIGYLGKLYGRSVFFVVRKGSLTGWVGTGVGVREEALREAELSLMTPSLFQDIVGARVSFWGPIIDPPARDFLIDALGWAPDDMLAIPITVRGKTVGVLYGDDRRHEVPEDDLTTVGRAAGEALERALAAKKSG